MSLTIVLICLLAERFLLRYQYLRKAEWFTHYRDWLERLEPPKPLREGWGNIISLMLPPVLLVALLQQLMESSLLGIPGAVFGSLILLYCLGPEDLDSQVTRFTESRDKGNDEDARTIARELMIDEPPIKDPSFSQAVTESILDQANNRIFSVIFWFLILGPMGAALYRLASIANKQGDTGSTTNSSPQIQQLLAILNWIPVRITAATYALMGSFEDALSGWRIYLSKDSDEFSSAASGILICTGLGALKIKGPQNTDNYEESNEYLYLPEAAMGLIWRSLLAWLFLLSIFTLAGWI